MYPRSAASPERIAVGTVVQISDGAVQTSAVVITVRGQGGAEATGAGTTVYGASGVVYYTPTQAETNFTSFVVIASKAACIPVAQTILTTASATPGTVLLAPVTHTSAVVPTVMALTSLPAVPNDWLTAAGLAADAVTEIRDKIVERTTLRGTVGTGSTTANLVVSAITPATTDADQIKGRFIIFDHDTVTPALRGQAAAIASHTAGATPTLTLAAAAWTVAPVSGNTFTVV